MHFPLSKTVTHPEEAKSKHAQFVDFRKTVIKSKISTEIFHFTDVRSKRYFVTSYLLLQGILSLGTYQSYYYP